MSLTNFAALTENELTVWQRDIWHAARNQQFLNQFTGDGDDAMIQRVSELTKTQKGARAVMTLVADLEGDGVAGDRTLEGNEEEIKSYDQVIELDQLRHANRHKGRMADQRSVVKFRKESKSVLSYWMADRLDQMGFLTLSGVSYTKHNDGRTRTGSDLANLEFAASVTAPTTKRHRRWDSTTGLSAGDTTVVDATDKPTWAMMIEIKAYLETHYVKPIRMDNGVSLYHVFMHPNGVAKLKQDENFLKNWREAMPTSKDHPLFKGANTMYVDGMAIHSYRHVYNTSGAASGSKWGAGSAIDGQRIICAGAQAMGFADLGTPEWVEKGFDYENQQGISLGKIIGFLKPKFHSIYDRSVEDFGALVVDTAI